MPVETQNERLAKLTAAGTAVWLDQISRSLTEGGELRRLVDELSLRGETSNPAIFEKAILGSADYDEQIARLARDGADARAIYQAIAVEDVAAAADVLRGVHDELDGADGFVSLEVDPDLAFDTDRTIAQAREYWQRVDRPNLMIKIPGTDEGVPAIEEATYTGINVNVTLLFNVEAYARVAEAYIRGLERRHAEGRSLDVHSVASFFVSRVDTEVDKRLEALGRTDLAGMAAIANARAAYRRYQEIFEGERFAALREAGAPVQRPLWASTGVKNPGYSDTMYVDGLVAPDTVNTMPMATLQAAADHAQVSGPTALEDPAAALAALRDAGIDMDDVTDTLLSAGVDAFVTPMESLLAGLDRKREAFAVGRPEAFGASLTEALAAAVAEAVERGRAEDVVDRVWAGDPTLWGPAGQSEVTDRLGWLRAPDVYADHLAGLREFAGQARADGFTDALLLGMGGSSLAPEVLRRSCPDAPALRLHVLDSTDPGAALKQVGALDLERTLVVVSTKSGGTIETLSLFEHVWALGPDGERFVAITDPGSSLQALAGERGFRRTFLNDPEIGGRFSALSLFGLVPAALAGIDLDELVEGARDAAQQCRLTDRPNPGLWLGAALGALACAGRDKLTLVVDGSIAAFALWAEQLLAESTGKQGKGILPVADEPLGAPDAYGDDRVLLHLRHMEEPDARTDEAVASIAAAGVPVLTLPTCGAADLGRGFFLAQFATAVAGWALALNPFDQPDVQAAKDATSRVLADGAPRALAEATDDDLRELLGGAAPPEYVALLGYVQPSAGADAAIASLRAALRDATRSATTFGYGPRYLHSTGQLHKGGPPTGRFLVFVHDGPQDAEVPGRDFTLRTLKNAQAAGDIEALRATGRPVAFVRLGGDDAAAAVRGLLERVTGLL